jgi:hypothetical protein
MQLEQASIASTTAALVPALNLRLSTQVLSLLALQVLSLLALQVHAYKCWRTNLRVKALCESSLAASKACQQSAYARLSAQAALTSQCESSLEVNDELLDSRADSLANADC